MELHFVNVLGSHFDCFEQAGVKHIVVIKGVLMIRIINELVIEVFKDVMIL